MAAAPTCHEHCATALHVLPHVVSRPLPKTWDARMIARRARARRTAPELLQLTSFRRCSGQRPQRPAPRRLLLPMTRHHPRPAPARAWFGLRGTGGAAAPNPTATPIGVGVAVAVGVVVAVTVVAGDVVVVVVGVAVAVVFAVDVDVENDVQGAKLPWAPACWSFQGALRACQALWTLPSLSR